MLLVIWFLLQCSMLVLSGHQGWRGQDHDRKFRFENPSHQRLGRGCAAGRQAIGHRRNRQGGPRRRQLRDPHLRQVKRILHSPGDSYGSLPDPALNIFVYVSPKRLRKGQHGVQKVPAITSASDSIFITMNPIYVQLNCGSLLSIFHKLRKCLGTI